MSELRQDPITHDWVIINPDRAKRPEDTRATSPACPFCAGNEHLTRALGTYRQRRHDPDYNLIVVTPPLDQLHRRANHWFGDVLPRTTTAAGFALGSRINVNMQTPERAAAELRAAPGEADKRGGGNR